MQLLADATDLQAPLACARELLDALPPVMRFVRRHMRSHRHKTLSLPQFRVLALLRSAPAVNLSAVADFLDTSLPTASRIVSGLVAKGFVTRHECESDRRQMELKLTAKGSGVMETARHATEAKLSKELAALGAADLKAVLQGLSLLHSVFAPGLRLASLDSNGKKHSKESAVL